MKEISYALLLICLSVSCVSSNKYSVSNLDGEWEFYWNQLISPEDFNTQDIPDPIVVKVPDSWTNYKSITGDYVPVYGYATYRYKFKLDSSYTIKNLGIFIPKIWCSTTIWINDTLIYKVGKVGNSYENYKNKILEKVSLLRLDSREVTLIVQVANFDFFLSRDIAEF